MKKSPLELLIEASVSSSLLKRLGLEVSSMGSLVFTLNNPVPNSFRAYLNHLNKNDIFPVGGHTNRQIVVFCLGKKQERQNGYISEDQLLEVNNYCGFDKPITFEEVQEANKFL